MTYRIPDSATIASAIETLTAAGYVVLKAKSYRQAQERQRVAEALLRSAEEEAEHARVWARGCLAEERRMGDRVTFLYGEARARGATVEDLKGPVVAAAGRHPDVDAILRSRPTS